MTIKIILTKSGKRMVKGLKRAGKTKGLINESKVAKEVQGMMNSNPNLIKTLLDNPHGKVVKTEPTTLFGEAFDNIFNNLERATRQGNIQHVATIKGKEPKNRKMSRKNKKLLKKLQAMMLENSVAKKCTGFMFDKAKNIVLMPEPEAKYSIVKGRLIRTARPAKGLDDPAFVMIDAGLNIYRKITFAQYKALCKIRFIDFRIKITLFPEGGEDFEHYAVIDKKYTISSLNQLFHILAHREGILEALIAFHEDAGWYTPTSTEETMKILYKNKTVEVISLDKFLKNHKIYG
jgi:hypothetical protein